MIDWVRRVLGITPYAPNVRHALRRTPTWYGRRGSRNGNMLGWYTEGLLPEEAQALRTVEREQQQLRQQAQDLARRWGER